MAHVTFPKPSSLDRDVAKYERRMARAKAKTAQERVDAAVWKARCLEIFTRDHGRSRASGTVLTFRGPDPRTVADPHHIVFRSAGGSDETFNVVTLTRREHDQVHLKDPRVQLLVDGDADRTLTFTEIDRETGRVIRVWDSPCPK